MLQRGTTRVECVGMVIVQQAAEGGHVEVRVAAEAAGKIGGVVTGTKDATKLGVEQVLCHSSIKMSNKQNVLQNMFKLQCVKYKMLTCLRMTNSQKLLPLLQPIFPNFFCPWILMYLTKKANEGDIYSLNIQPNVNHAT